ncbi:prolyl aminopeptidase [Virgisporangium ochraceum]|uniref:Proline iminopeptidase n=1 Tax=Virgisporangium ochraceum TaxID=65505 RepID=A0A8J4EFM9_9ACTN|nr:prolyl aminopeptidase [Virgisporangium ochraceum]GIJ73855.1 proline iminopeptidase [Virgisporangium ochraceum]
MNEGMLDVGDGNLVHWEVSGHPEGRPALVVHGGPGSPWPGADRFFDLDRYRVVSFDQRGCGRSRPHAADPATDMGPNTTGHLIADMERLREHLGIERWLLFGGSWGSTLILAYAERYPHRVSEIVIVGVTTSRWAEIEWLYQGVGRFLPRQWEIFRDGVPPADRTDLRAILAGYARLLDDPDADVRTRAAAAWTAWEDSVIGHETNGKPDSYSDQPPDDLVAMVRTCAHYFSNGMWLDDGILLREAHKLAGIPGVLIHGRLDLSSPLDTAWQLTKAWPDADLVVVDDAGHTGSVAMREAMREALARFADR